jgi:8-oxo-dGTP diphosphatase
MACKTVEVVTEWIDLCYRTAFRVGFPVARMWWKLTRPRHQGAMVAVYVGSDLLLVRSSYRKEWHLPGGGVRRDETPKAAAHRELAEEIGLSTTALFPAGSACGLWDGRRDRVHFFELRLNEIPLLRLDNREIIATRLTPIHELGAMALTEPTIAYLKLHQS